jgi:glycerophosphoryl diester phosphodiesterase
MIKRTLAAMAAFFVALSTAASTPAAAQTPALPACPTVIAHRAGANVAPENTAIGITMSAAQGAAAVEMDVRWSANANTQANPGYPVLMHDPTVDRTTASTGSVDTFGLGQLTAMKAQAYAPWNTDPRFASTTVPYAWDFINASSKAGVDMLLDVKVTPGEWGARKLIEYVDRFGYRSHLTYMGSVDNVTAMHGWFPDLNYLVIEYPPAGRLFTGEYLRSVGADGYAVPWDRVTPAMVAYFHSYGLVVNTWTSDRPTYDDAAHWQILTTAGVDQITTNEPAALLAWEQTHCGTGPTTAPTTAPTQPPTTQPTTSPTTEPATTPASD